MPTAAKLVAAVLFAAIGLMAAMAYVPQLPEGSQIGRLREVCAGIGLSCGWFVMGRLVGKGYGAAMGFGVRTSVTVAVWALLFFSIYEMVVQSTRMRYDGPMEAVVATFGILLDYGRLMLAPEVIGVLLIGGLVGGMLTEAVGRRWS